MITRNQHLFSWLSNMYLIFCTDLLSQLGIGCQLFSFFQYKRCVTGINFKCSKVFTVSSPEFTDVLLCLFLIEVSVLMICGTTSLGNRCLTFWDSMVVSYSAVKMSLMRPPHGLKTLDSSHPVTWHHTLEEWRPQLHHFKSLASWILQVVYHQPVML